MAEVNDLAPSVLAQLKILGWLKIIEDNSDIELEYG